MRSYKHEIKIGDKFGRPTPDETQDLEDEVTIVKAPSLVVNSIRTPDGTVLISHTRHDFVSHIDATTGMTYAVDGGNHYLRRLGPDDYTENSAWSNEGWDLLRHACHWGTRLPDDDQERKLVSVAEMSTNHLQKVLQMENLCPVKFKIMTEEMKFRTDLDNVASKIEEIEQLLFDFAK
jgi:hypothetical protein